MFLTQLMSTGLKKSEIQTQQYLSAAPASVLICWGNSPMISHSTLLLNEWKMGPGEELWMEAGTDSWLSWSTMKLISSWPHWKLIQQGTKIVLPVVKNGQKYKRRDTNMKNSNIMSWPLILRVFSIFLFCVPPWQEILAWKFFKCLVFLHPVCFQRECYRLLSSLFGNRNNNSRL